MTCGPTFDADVYAPRLKAQDGMAEVALTYSGRREMSGCDQTTPI